MSDIKKLIEELEDDIKYLDDEEGRYTKEIRDISEAISAIKELSEKYNKAVADVVRLSTQDKWHDLRKNAENLPKEFEVVLVICEDGRKELAKYEDWINQSNKWFSIHSEPLNVVKWCEIPKESVE